MDLPEDEVHFFYTRLAEADPRLAQYRALLSPGEINRANRFRFEKDRCSHILAHGLLRQLLGRYLDVSPGDIAYETNNFGKPSLAPSLADSAIQFNMSHTDGMAVYALSLRRPVGVDVECMNRRLPDRDQIAADFFAAEETADYRALPENQRTVAFYNCWTRKEAFIKALGTGLSHPLDSFCVTLRPDQPARLLSTQTEDRETWTMESVEPAPGFKAAVVAQGLWRLRYLGQA